MARSDVKFAKWSCLTVADWILIPAAEHATIHTVMVSPQVFWPYCALVAFTIAALAAAGREILAAKGIEKTRPLGRISLAIPMAVFGAEHLSSGHNMLNAVPAWMPDRLFWIYFVGVALTVAALSIIFRIRMRLAAALLGFMLLCFVLMIHIPNAIAAPRNRIAWTIVARDSSFSAGAILLAVASLKGKASLGEARLARAAFYLVAVVCVFFGIEHFLHPECVPAVPLEKVVPAWMPLGRLWTLLTGVLLVVGGAAMFAKRTARQAAAALGVWVLALVLSFYLAIMIAKPDIEGVNYFADTLLFAGVLLNAPSAYRRAGPV